MEINYLSVAGFGRLAKVSGKKGRMLTVTVEDAEDGYLSFGPINCRFAGGEATLCISPLPDGIYHPVLNCKGYSLKLEAVRLQGETVIPCPTEDWVVRHLINRQETLESRVLTLEEKLGKLTEQVMGRGFFDGLFD